MSLGRKTSLVLALQVAGAGLGYIAALVTGRFVVAGAYGQYLFALSAFGFIALLTSLGFGEAHVHFLARGVPRAQALGVYARLRVVLALVMTGIGLAVVWYLLDDPRLADATTVPILAVALAIQVVGTLRQIPFDTWVGHERVNRPEAAKLVENVLIVVLIALLGLAIAGSQGRWTPAGSLAPRLAMAFRLPAGGPDVATAGLLLAVAYLAAKAMSALVTLVWWVRDRPRLAPWDPALARDYARYAVPVALTSATVLVMSYTDVVMVGFFQTSAEVGYYGMAQRLAGLVLLTSTALGTPLLPRFSTLLREGRHDEGRSMLADSERYLLLVAIPLAAGLVALPEAILHIAVGDNYLGAAGPLRFLGLWALAIAATTPARTKVLGGGHARAILQAGILAAALNVALNLVLVPAQGLGLGATGAAIGSLAATTAAGVFMRIQVHRRFGDPLWPATHAKLLAAGALTTLAWSTAWSRLGPAAFDRVWELFGWLAGGLVLFGLLAAAFGVLRRAEVRTFLALASPRALWREMRGRAR